MNGKDTAGLDAVVAEDVEGIGDEVVGMKDDELVGMRLNDPELGVDRFCREKEGKGLKEGLEGKGNGVGWEILWVLLRLVLLSLLDLNNFRFQRVVFMAVVNWRQVLKGGMGRRSEINEQRKQDSWINLDPKVTRSPTTEGRRQRHSK